MLLDEAVGVGLGRVGAGGAAGPSVVRVDAQPRLHHHRTVMVLVPAGGVCRGGGQRVRSTGGGGIAYTWAVKKKGHGKGSTLLPII